jgi:cytochrome c oxidase subunit 1
VAIDTTPLGEVEYPGEEGVGAPPRPPAGWRRSQWLRPNIIWAVVGAVVGYLIGHWLGNIIAGGYLQTVGASDENDVAVVLGLVLGVTGWMAGIGGLTYPLAKVLGYELSPAPPESSWVRYFRMTDDHKVVGWQYAVGVLTFLFTGGLLAMLIRTELLSPTSHVFGPGTYIAIVSEHGTIMMMMASSAVVGPLGNWLVPLMIGSRRMAYPRVESF